MFGPATLTLLNLLLVLSVLTHQALLLLLTLALLLAAGLSELWRRYCLAGVEYRRRFSRRRVSFGDRLELEVEIVNRKLLPLAWLEVEDEIPRALPPARGRVYISHKADRALLCGVLALRPYERVRRRYTIPCLVRGEHEFGPVWLRSGDLFGLVTREVVLAQSEKIVVWPRVIPLTALGLPARQPLGDLRTQSWLFEDPTRIAGARDYRPGDSQRRIHWPASLRAQRLQARVYEPSTSHKLVLFLNLHTASAWWGLSYDPDALELSITTAASIAAWACQQGYQVGLVTNGMHRMSSHRVGVEPSGDRAHLRRLLDALGRLQPFAVRPFEVTLGEGSSRLAFGTTVVVVTALLSAEVAAALVAMRRRGHPTTLVLTGREVARPSLDGVVVRRVGPPAAWREVAALAPASA